MTNDHLITLKNFLFFDLETVPAYQSFEELPERLQKLWIKKADRLYPDQTSAESFSDKAGIYAEFGKIVSIGLGFFHQMEDEVIFRSKVLFDKDEEKLLQDFANILNKRSRIPWVMVAHNGFEFDLPYLCRRMMVHHIPLPVELRLAGKKPWEVSKMHRDTMEMWKFGDRKAFTALELLAALFDISTPKDDIDGSQVRDVYYEDNDLERIAAYCQKDVVTLMQVYLNLIGYKSLEAAAIHLL